MTAEFENKVIRREAAANNDLACLVCPHVLCDVKAAKFLCRIQDGYVCSCDEHCSEFENGVRLGMIHLGHVLSSDPELLNLGGLPINIALHRSDKSWSASYFLNEYEPTEGDFVAPPEGDKLFDTANDEDFFVFSLSDTQLVVANLDDGFQVVPVWKSASQCNDFQRHLIGNERLVKQPYGQIRNWAKDNNVWFLAPNFLSNPVDYALIV